MRGLLGLTADFIDRMSNPAYGTTENENHAVRFAELMARDEELGRLLDATDLGAGDVDLLSTTGWLWYLRWRRDAAVDLPASEFFDALYDRVVDPVVRLGVLDAICCHSSVVRRFSEVSDKQVTIESLPRFWVRDRLFALVRREEIQGSPGEREAPSWSQVVELTTLLLQIGNVVALTTIRALVATAWERHGSLVGLVGDILRASALDDEDLMSWQQRLGLRGPGPKEG